MTHMFICYKKKAQKFKLREGLVDIDVSQFEVRSLKVFVFPLHTIASKFNAHL